ncbi:GTP cyclohydrolase II [Gordonia sp. SCSIO 19800]|uniref:GTP cyclohydrolase II n=1 Tax=Gordonia sp. SCSIO 19800 TaxID=2826926 RepID=UPI001B810903|nr:GTP cyclohydrolase II [Gordonia sp. SCSIO 19800]MBR7194629.1 GTP cyclohydrolase II [Gordonia sp. SCSIO 19800]
MEETVDENNTLSVTDFEHVIARLRSGGMVIVSDDPGRENEADLIMAAELATADALAFIVRHTTGIVCAPMSDERADTLDLPLMVTENRDPHATAFTVSVDAVSAGTGVSAADRARTLRALADPGTRRSELRRPGHIFPLRARPGGVQERPGHTEAAVDLLRLAGLTEVGVISELVVDDGSMMRGPQVLRFAEEHDLPVLSIAELKERTAAPAPDVVDEPEDEADAEVRSAIDMTGAAELPTTFGHFRALAYRSPGAEHLVLVAGEIAAANKTDTGVLVRVHSECITGDLAGSLRCDCGEQLRESLALIAEEGNGILIYLRGHEGRGIGLGRKLQAYALQEKGLDTVDANTALGLPIDNRDYRVAAQILADLGVDRIRMITNNPDKQSVMSANGVHVVDRVRLSSKITAENIHYLLTKRDRLGHFIDLVDDAERDGFDSDVSGLIRSVSRHAL